MLRVRVLIDTDVLDAVRHAAINSPSAMRREMGKIASGPIARRMLVELMTPPPKPRYPIRWKTKKQRRYVMMKLREEGNLPYQRTGRLERGWRITVNTIRDAGSLNIENDTPYTRFVQGDDAQPFHLDTGWAQLADVEQRYRDEVQDAVIDAWFRVSQGFK